MKKGSLKACGKRGSFLLPSWRVWTHTRHTAESAAWSLDDGAALSESGITALKALEAQHGFTGRTAPQTNGT